MEQTNPAKINPQTKGNEEEWRNICENLMQKLPKTISWSGSVIYHHEGFWYPQHSIKGIVYLQKYFEPRKTDIILASNPKSGTNWLRALTFTIVNRSQYSLKNTPLLNTNIRELAPVFEIILFKNDSFPDLDRFTEPRIITTHASYGSLPDSITKSEKKIVYICRNPLDQFISIWHFVDKIHSPEVELISLEKAFESFLQGVHPYGPFWDHTLGYWKTSIERPDKVLFLQYEDMKKDTVMNIKKLANFLGFPFSDEEEKRGLIQDISNFCGFENMKNLTVNKTGENSRGIPNSAFYRKGRVGDFKNHLSLDMVEKMEKLMQEKFDQFGLRFNVS